MSSVSACQHPKKMGCAACTAADVFQLKKADGTLVPSSDNGEVEVGNVDSGVLPELPQPTSEAVLSVGRNEALSMAAGCGVVPTKHAHLAEWTPGNYVADGDYFHSLSEQLPRTYLIPKAS